GVRIGQKCDIRHEAPAARQIRLVARLRINRAGSSARSELKSELQRRNDWGAALRGSIHDTSQVGSPSGLKQDVVVRIQGQAGTSDRRRPRGIGGGADAE